MPDMDDEAYELKRIIGGKHKMSERKLVKQEGVGFWSPEKKGDVLEGDVIKVDTEGDYGTRYLIKTKEGDEILTPSHKVLQSRMIKAKAGSYAKIVYEGEEPPAVKGYSPTQLYEVWLG